MSKKGADGLRSLGEAALAAFHVIQAQHEAIVCLQDALASLGERARLLELQALARTASSPAPNAAGEGFCLWCLGPIAPGEALAKTTPPANPGIEIVVHAACLARARAAAIAPGQN